MFGLIAFVVICVTSVWVAVLVPRRLRPIAWIVVVCAGVVPWSSWVGHADWGRVQWMPFSSAIRLRDIVLNVLLYVPFGYFLAGALKPRGGWGAVAVAAACGFALSVATELSQVYGPGRFPGATDVVTNTTGAAIGSMVGRWRESRRARGGASA